MKTRWRLLILLSVCLMGLFASALAARADGLEVHFLSVERNDGILIRCGGEDVFIDSGLYSFGEVSRDYLYSVGVDHLKYYIGTHAHRDHVGGGTVILDSFETGAVLQPHDVVKTAMLACVKKESERQAVEAARYITVRPGDRYQVGGATLTCLGPLSIRKTSYKSDSENHNSLVLMLSYGEVDILLAADATANSLRAIEAANPGCLRADVLKNPHHDGATKTDILEAIRPDYTIISTGDKNLPVRKFTNTLLNLGSEVLSTADRHCGNIVLYTDGRDISFRTEFRAESLTLNQSSVEVYEGKYTRVKATLNPSRRYKAISFSSDNPSVAVVDAEGKITGVSAGETIIRARDASGVEAICRVTVSPATMTLRKTELKVRQGSRVSASWKIQPSGSKPVITWASRDERIATVDERGRITGVYPGVTQITATMPSGQVSAITITVEPVKVSSVRISPSSVKMTLGESRTVTAKISPKNATWPEVTWSSDDTGIVTVDANGTLRAVGVGKTTITATTKEGKSRTARITVNPVYVKKIYLSADGTDGLIGGVNGCNQVKLSWQIEPMNATIQDVEWATSNKRVATVDENGVVTGHQEGSVTITCKATDGSRRYTRIKLKFGRNELNRTVKAAKGEMLVQASRIRFQSNGQLEIRMTYSNRMGTKQEIQPNGWLVLITPEGEQVPLMTVQEKARMLSNGSSRSYTYRIPQSVAARLNGINLTRCDAAIVNLNGR